MSFQYEDDFLDELGADDATTAADWATGGIASAGKAVTQLLTPSRAGQTMSAKEQADRLKAFQMLGYVDAAGNRTDKPMPTITDISSMGTALGSGGSTTGLSGLGPAEAAQRDWLINMARAASSLPSPSTPRIETPGATPAVATPPTLPALDLSGITSALDPRLRRILGGVNAMRLQAEATSEHNALAKEATFRREAIRRLTAIEQKLPRTSRLSQQIRTVKVLLG
jgi:hypothetical protein